MTKKPWRIVLAVWVLTVAPSLAEPPSEADPRDGFRQLGKLQAGLAYRAREEERSPLKAALFFLKSAQAFQRAGDSQAKDEALVAGIVAAQPLRASWEVNEHVVAMGFLPGDKQILICGADGQVHIRDAATGRDVRSFRSPVASEEHGIEGAALSPDLSRLLVWEWMWERDGKKTLQLWDVPRGQPLRKWDRGWEPGSRGGHAATAGGVFLGSRLLLWGTAKPAEVWDADGKRRLHTIDKGWVDSPSLSQDGSRLLTTDPAQVYLWDLAHGTLVRTLKINNKSWEHPQSLLSPDGKRVLVMGPKGATARVFDTSTGKRLATFVHHNDRRDLSDDHLDGAWSPDGTRLLTWGNGRKVKLWDVERRRLLHTFGGGDFLSAQFCLDGTRVLTLGRPVMLWDAKTGEFVARYGEGTEATFTRDGSRLLILGGQEERYEAVMRVEMWNVKGEERIGAFQVPGSPSAVRLSEDETLLLVKVSAQGFGAVQLWDLAQPEGRVIPEDEPLPRAPTFKHAKPVRSAVLSRDEARLLTSDEDGQAYLWGTAEVQKLQSFAHGDGILGAAFNPDESQVLTWGDKGAVKLWDTKTGKELRTFDHTADVRGATFSPDGSHLLTRDSDYTVWWWDVSRPKPVHTFEHPRDVFGAELNPKATRILTWGLDGKARLWDATGGKLVATLAHDGPVFGAAFGDEGRVWTWSADGLREWDMTNSEVLRHQVPADGVASAQLSRDCKRFLLRTGDGRVQLWDVGAGECLRTFDMSYHSFVYSERAPAGLFNRDQTRVLAWPHGSVYLWDVASGVRLKWFRHAGPIRGAAFTHDESSVLTWGADCTARLWEASVPRPLSPDDQLLELGVRSGLQINEEGKLCVLTPEGWPAPRKVGESVPKQNGLP